MRAPRTWAAASLAPASAAAVLAAAWLDADHDLPSDYVSWLSSGPYWWLAALGIMGIGLAAAVAARRLGRALSGSSRLVVMACLACTIALAAMSIALPSRGFGEPLWRTATHVGIAVGAYVAIGAAAAVLVRQQRRQELAGPGTAIWAAGMVGGMLFLGLTAALARLVPAAPDLRGLGQLVLMVLAAAWLSVASRVARAS